MPDLQAPELHGEPVGDSGRMKVAVVGAGIMGASTALALSDRGHSVTLFEQFPLGHAQGSSHGRSRIVRRAYPDPFYTEIMQVGYPLWAELERRLGEQLVHECGLVYFGSASSPNMNQMIRGLAGLGVNHQVLDQQGVTTVLPHLKLRSEEIGVFTPEAGWVRADRAVSGSVALAVQNGATLVQEVVADPRALLHSFDRVLSCAGGWNLKWFEIPASVHCQTFAYVRTTAPMLGPVFIEDNPDLPYGIPSEPGASTIKVGIHALGPEVDPANIEREPSQARVDQILDFVSERFGLDQPEVETATACLYTATSNEDFRFGQEDDRLFWASPCSGHGFKFGPWVGRLMADFAEGNRRPSDYPRFLAEPN